MYDAVIIGAGPAGYVCAISLARQGAKVCVVEKNGLGGTCTQKGCIPTKYLHSMGNIVRKAKSAKKFGINSNIEIDYSILSSKMKSTVSNGDGAPVIINNNNVDNSMQSSQTTAVSIPAPTRSNESTLRALQAA